MHLHILFCLFFLFSLLQSGDGCFLSVLNLMEVVSSSKGPYSTETSAHSYFHSLCHQSFPGPLVGGNVGNKELNKWIDERISNCDSLEMNYSKGQGLKLLLSLLKIACQHYGKFRSFGGDSGPKVLFHLALPPPPQTPILYEPFASLSTLILNYQVACAKFAHFCFFDCPYRVCPFVG